MSEFKTLTICYTDIRGSTKTNEQLGNKRMEFLKNEHFRVLEELAHLNSGKVVKNLGDGLLCHFDNPSDAIHFGSELQVIETEHPGLKRIVFEVRVAFSHSEVTLKELDIQGKAANKGARILQVTEPKQILFDNAAHEALKSHWGPDEVEKYCACVGEKTLKDFGSQKLWEFEWQKFDSEKGVIGTLVQGQLGRAGFELINTVKVPLSGGGEIFWPVVPRKIATAIHQGQLEAIRLLGFCGWTIHLLIADSANLSSKGESHSDSFERRIKEYAEKIGVSLGHVQHLSQIIADHESLSKMFVQIKKVTDKLKVGDLLEYEGKSYEDREKYVRDKQLSDFLRPIYTIGAFLMFAGNKSKHKVMVIAGNDERTQWNDVLDKCDLHNRMNLILNPELKRGPHLVRQTENWPSWRSRQQCLEQMPDTNLEEWLFNLFVLLPRFPSKHTICDKYCKERDCKKRNCGKSFESCRQTAEITEALLSAVSEKLDFA